MPDLVFPSADRTVLDDANIRKALSAIVTKAEVRQRRSIVHVIRHTFARLLVQQREWLVYVREQMGHSSINVTADFYGHLVWEGIGRRLTASMMRTHLSAIQWQPPPNCAL